MRIPQYFRTHRGRRPPESLRVRSGLGITLFLLFFILPGLLPAQEKWIAIEKICPVDGATCALLEPAAPPAPVLSQPARFDALEEPFSHPNSWFQCRSCGFACYMTDFKKMEPAQAKKALAIASAMGKPDEERSYNMTKFSERLEVAQLYFPVLGRTGQPAFLADFYRLKGYVYDQDNQHDKAREARTQARMITADLIKDGKNAGLLREYLWELAALDYRLGDHKTALENLERAAKLRYYSQMLNQQGNEQRNRELTNLIADLQQRIESDDKKAAEQKHPVKNP